MIEGFPRSGNDFAVTAFQLAQPRPVKTADHVHAAAQIKRAARMGIPACVLIRRPEEAVRSLVVKYPFLRPSDALRGYARFYESCWRYRDDFVIARFEEVTQDFGRVIGRINDRFGTRFERFEGTVENERRVFRVLRLRNCIGLTRDHCGDLPKPAKEVAKRNVDLSEHPALVARCREVFERFLSVPAGRADP